MTVKTLGVIGAGVMGLGVAQRAAEAGYSVLLVDNSPEAISEAERKISRALRFRKLFGGSTGSAPLENVLSRINFSAEPGLLAKADYVIENVTENWAIKSTVYQELDAVCPPACMFAANTSAIPITRIASLTKRPDKVIGVHFMNPVPAKNTVELILGHHTSAQTKAITTEVLQKMQMTAIEVNDAPGFVSNRVLMLMVNEAIFLLHEHVASAEAVDEVFRKCMGHPMGPLETADLIGLDTILNSLDVLYDGYQDPKFRPCPLLKKMVAAGLHGRKSGEGFYKHEYEGVNTKAGCC
jgi:3-hydroxybutyryl-CoA dehydrogenase